MRSYTLMLVGDERSPVRRVFLPGNRIKQAVISASVVVVLLIACLADYGRLRGDVAELDSLRAEASEQRAQIETFKRSLAQAQADLQRVGELERKVRIIANLPGAASLGGEDISELAPDSLGVGTAEDPMLPVGVPVTPVLDSAALEGVDPNARGGIDTDMEGLTTGGAAQLETMDELAQTIAARASERVLSLDELVEQLEQKSAKLASLPSIWPARGWLTSRYGYRISPFTGRRQMHAGLDIAAREGTPVIAPARGRVSFVGRKGPLGNCLVIDHGYGVRTLYGHNREIAVKVGQQVERGQRVASVGSTGRSTGPHLHYVVELAGKSTDPLNYIFD